MSIFPLSRDVRKASFLQWSRMAIAVAGLAPVAPVADDWMADSAELRSDLMVAASLQFDFDESRKRLVFDVL